MFENFITIEILLGLPGMIAVVVLLTQFTKSMFDKIGENRTKYVVYGWSFALCFLAASIKGEYTSISLIIQTLAIWLINSVIVWFTSMKSYEEGSNLLTKLLNK